LIFNGIKDPSQWLLNSANLWIDPVRMRTWHVELAYWLATRSCALFERIRGRPYCLQGGYGLFQITVYTNNAFSLTLRLPALLIFCSLQPVYLLTIALPVALLLPAGAAILLMIRAIVLSLL